MILALVQSNGRAVLIAHEIYILSEQQFMDIDPPRLPMYWRSDVPTPDLNLRTHNLVENHQLHDPQGRKTLDSARTISELCPNYVAISSHFLPTRKEHIPCKKYDIRTNHGHYYHTFH